MNDWLIQDLLLVFISLALASGLLRSLNARCGAEPWHLRFGFPWVLAAFIPGLLASVSYQLLVLGSGLAPAPDGADATRLLLRSVAEAALLMAALAFFPHRIPAAARLPAPPPEPASADNPRVTPRDEPYNAFVAAATLRGFLAGLAMGAGGAIGSPSQEWLAFGMGTVASQLNLAAAGALAAWAIARWRTGHRRSLAGGLLGCALLHAAFLLMLGSGFPWPLLANLLALMGLLVSGRYIADARIEHKAKPRKPAKQTGCKDC